MPCCVKCVSSGAKRIADGVFEMFISAPEIADAARPGQFIHIKCGEERILRRPISICDVGNGIIRIVFEVRGEGSRWLFNRHEGDVLDVLGPLGNGFDIPDGRVLLAGGGIGVAPLLFVSHHRLGRCDAVLGYKGADKSAL
ncbi:MAG: dihydroorotate dehydrogenase electron transfer subunit, partial [Oscillospiraceae bacterium]|nr:dihydroorotate dehydrogenase electron transfer subunit [Oscillospiraceae bacterium]